MATSSFKSYYAIAMEYKPQQQNKTMESRSAQKQPLAKSVAAPNSQTAGKVGHAICGPFFYFTKSSRQARRKEKEENAAFDEMIRRQLDEMRGAITVNDGVVRGTEKGTIKDRDIVDKHNYYQGAPRTKSLV